METRQFKSTGDFRNWLEAHHTGTPGLWLRIFKKDSGRASVTYAEALDQALCFGWIDGQKKPLDALSWLQKFTPRRPRSNWSQRNTEHAARLIQSGAMTPTGLAAVAAAKADGRWQQAYAALRDAAPPADFLKELHRDKKATAFFKSLNRANVYAIVYRLQTAKKPETRARRMQTILAMMQAGQKFHA